MKVVMRTEEMSIFERELEITDDYLLGLNKMLNEEFVDAPLVTLDTIRVVTGHDWSDDVKLHYRNSEHGIDWLYGVVRDYLEEDAWDEERKLIEQSVEDCYFARCRH